MKYSILLCPLLFLIACGDDAQYSQYTIAYGSTATLELTAYESCGAFNFDSSCGDHAIAVSPDDMTIAPPQAVRVNTTNQTGMLQVDGLSVGDGEVHFETALGDVTWALSVKPVGLSQYVFFPLDEANPKRVAYMPGTTMHIQATYFTADQAERLLGRFDTPWEAIDDASQWKPSPTAFAINPTPYNEDSKLRRVATDKHARALDNTLLNSFVVPQRVGQYTMSARGTGQEITIDVVQDAAITDIIPCDRPTPDRDQFCLDFLIDQAILMAGKPTIEVNVRNDQQCDVRATYDDLEQRWQWSANAREFVDHDDLKCTFDVIVPNAAQDVVRGFEAHIKHGRVERVVAQSL